MKYWRVEKEEYVTHVVHIQAETSEEAIKLAEGQFKSYNSWYSKPWVEEMSEQEFLEETEE